MFHLHTFEGIQTDISLNRIKEHFKVKKINKDAKSRKYIEDREPEKDPYLKGMNIQYAKKAYSESIEKYAKGEEIIHAYQIMNTEIRSIAPDATIVTAWKYFQETTLKNVPVMQDDKLIGIVALFDILTHIIIKDNKIEMAHDLLVSDVMRKDIVTAEAVTDIRRIAHVMFENHISTMPITNKEKVIGIITRADILHTFINNPEVKLWA